MFDKTKVEISFEIESYYDLKLKELLKQIIELNLDNLKIEVDKQCQN